MKYVSLDEFLEKNGQDSVAYEVTVSISDDMSIYHRSFRWIGKQPNSHPFECIFDDENEAVRHAKAFDKRLAEWTFENVSSPLFRHHEIEVCVVKYSVREFEAECILVRRFDMSGTLEYEGPDRCVPYEPPALIACDTIEDAFGCSFQLYNRFINAWRVTIPY